MSSLTKVGGKVADNSKRATNGCMINKRTSKRRQYSIKEKYNIIEMCNNAVASNLFYDIKSLSRYFYHYYPIGNIAQK